MSGLAQRVRTWSAQQLAIFAWAIDGIGSAIVEAVAGSGKTTTLVELVARMVARFPGLTIAFAAYNKAIADEIGVKLADFDKSRIQSGTFHSFGLRAWKKIAPRVKVDGNKLRELATTMNIPWEYRIFAQKAVSQGKLWGIGATSDITNVAAWTALVERFDLADSLTEKGERVTTVEINRRIDEALGFAQDLLRASIDQARDVVDFDDMIYMPVLRRARVDQFDVVMVDEAQDTNPMRLALARMMLKPEGRLIAVGDSRQAIYGFAGADSDSMAKIATEFDAVQLPLTITYRCPKSVVAFARNWVSHIEAGPEAPEGSVRTIAMEDFDKLTTDDLRTQDAILCRNTAPLVKLAFSLIRRRIGCHVEGRDIGQGLVALAKKWKVATIAGLETKLAAYLDRERAKLTKKGDETKLASLEDKVETLRVIMQTLTGGDSIQALVDAINSIFGDTKDGKPADSLTLSTVHKSKGREWDRVYLLGRTKYMPSPFAKQDWQRVQEDNLIYVAVTRTKNELIEVTA